MPIIDQFSDAAFGTLYRHVQHMPGLEEFVKQASIEPEEATTLPGSAFAWGAERKYPLHTAEHAALSYAYAKTASNTPTQVMLNIKLALEVYGIPESTFAEQEVKIASLENDYILPEFKFLLVQNGTQVKHAQEMLLREMPKLDLEHRALACANMVKKADAYKVEVLPEILKIAGLVVSDLKETRAWLEARATQLPDADTTNKLAYQTLANGLKKMPQESSDRQGLLKVASAIAALDEKTGLDKHYDRKLPDALRTVFNTEKQASKSVDCGGTFITVAKLAQLPASFWEDLGGKELGDEIAPGGVVDHSKLATVVDTLPLDLKLQLRAHVGR